MWVNKAGNNENYTPQMLSELFSRGYRIDLKCFSGFVPNSCHQEVKLNFTEPDHQTIPKPNNPPLVSIIILSYNGLNHIEACLESIRRNTKESYEIIVVDNARKDGSIDFLRNVNDIVLIQNPENVGPAVARAQAMVMAQGEYLTFLDDDTIVPQGWLTKFIQLAERHPEIGMFGPLSNYASGLQHVPEASYHNLEEFEEFARQWSKQHKGQLSAAVRLVSFCLFIKRAVVEKIGTFDGNF